MKKVLIIRYPLSFPPSEAELSAIKTKERAGEDFIVLPFHSDVKKVEVEIVYDPHSSTLNDPRLKGDSLGNIQKMMWEAKDE